MNREPNLFTTPSPTPVTPVTRETQPLRSAPLTARLTPTWRDRWRSLRLNYRDGLIVAGIALGITLIVLALAWIATPVQSAPAPEPILYVVMAPTATPTSVAFTAREVIVYHAPAGTIAGAVQITDPNTVAVEEQYQGWIRFRTPHMEQSAWSLAGDLVGLVDGARLAAAPEIAPTAQPTIAPVIVYVAQPQAAPQTATQLAPVQLAPIVPPAHIAPTPIGSDQSWWSVPGPGCDGDPVPLVCVAAADPNGPGSSEKSNTKP